MFVWIHFFVKLSSSSAPQLAEWFCSVEHWLSFSWHNVRTWGLEGFFFILLAGQEEKKKKM
jgi:hypothetical protein